jgi:hypothetical protein
MGSRYLFIVLHVWLERMLTRGDYRRAEDEVVVEAASAGRPR